jgi:hypothetical protein
MCGHRRSSAGERRRHAGLRTKRTCAAFATPKECANGEYVYVRRAQAAPFDNECFRNANHCGYGRSYAGGAAGARRKALDGSGTDAVSV